MCYAICIQEYRQGLVGSGNVHSERISGTAHRHFSPIQSSRKSGSVINSTDVDLSLKRMFLDIYQILGAFIDQIITVSMV